MTESTTTIYTCDQCGAQAPSPGRGASTPKGWTTMFGGIRAHLCVDCTAILVPWFSRGAPTDDGEAS